MQLRAFYEPEQGDQEIAITLRDRSDNRAPQRIDVEVRLKEPGTHRREIPIRVQPLLEGAEAIGHVLVVRAHGMRSFQNGILKPIH